MYRILSKVIGEKKEWRAMEARAAALPRDFRTVYGEVKAYVWRFAGGDGRESIGALATILGLFETAAAEGRGVRDVTGRDVAAFCDRHLTGVTSWTDGWRASLNDAVARKVAD
ncbi:DUF1048 domain-containing protein [Phycicoccus sonneratiae]|uniref:DUF1048 domain-containing protein n=1 Tax=Phycicoccus sonneratiae TaxID=2807628 RepID=A0ABS2CL98_9MICO|nr:DUF1048 domain-containing protein [Phycicoccus sonneraticus]MBM6400667.1 DUF1048 domain-containing protein [Phycicoccus sonneraticus]